MVHSSLAALLCKVLPRQGEAHGESEVVGGSWVAARREGRCVGLAVVIGGEGEVLREGVVGAERDFECGVTAAGRGDACADVAGDGGLLA